MGRSRRMQGYQLKVGDLVKPAPAYLDDETDFVGIIVEEYHCDGGGQLEPETEFTVQWPTEAAQEPQWLDFELELVSAAR